MSREYEKYDRLRQSGSNVIVSEGDRTVYIIGYHEARQVLGDHKRFVKDPRNTLPADQRPPMRRGGDPLTFIYHNMLNMDAPDHTRLRNLVSKAFTNRQIQSLAPRIQEIADDLIDRFESKRAVDLVDAFAFPLPIIVICELLGVPSEDRDRFRVWSHAFLGIADDQFTYMKLMQEFVGYIGQMINARRANPQDDLISALVHAEDEGSQLNEQELYSMIALLIVAGHETTVNLISNGMAALLQNRDQLALLQSEPDRIDAAIEEFLRFTGPVEMATMRYAAEDVEVGGNLIERGRPLVVILAAANRDPAVFEGAPRLNIERASNQHLGFSYGVHYCVGAPLARLEAKIAVETLLRRIPSIELAVRPSRLRYSSSSIVHGLETLPVRW